MADPDFHIREGPRHPDPELRGAGGVSPKNLFQPFGPQFGVKIREDPSPGSVTDHSSTLEILVVAPVIVSLAAVFWGSVA